MSNEKNKGNIVKFWLIFLIAVSILSVSRRFLNLTHFLSQIHFLSQTHLFLDSIAATDIISLLGIINAVFLAILFKLKEWTFVTVCGIIGIMLILSIFSGRPHLIVLYSISLGSLILLINKNHNRSKEMEIG